MDQKKAFKFCPRCGGTLSLPEGNRLSCLKCRYGLYINPLVTNGVIIENNDGDILLVKRACDPQKGQWDVPGGFIQPKESFDASVKRELMEELNVRIAIDRIIGIYTDTYLFDGVTNDTICIMVAAHIISGAITPDEDAEAFEFFSKKEILKQKIAFEGVRKGIEDYIKSTTSFPNLTA